MTSDFTFTNKLTDESNKLGKDNYAVVTSDPGKVILENITTNVDATEIITFLGSYSNGCSTTLPISATTRPTEKSVQFQIKVEDTLRTLDDKQAPIEDDPIVAYLTVRLPRSGAVSNENIATVVNRVLAACKDGQGNYRFDELRRLALEPTNF